MVKAATDIAPIQFGRPEEAPEPKVPEINFEDLSTEAKQEMLGALKASLKASRDEGLGDTHDVSPLLKNIEDLINGRTTIDKSATAFENKLELARANLRDQIEHIDPDMYPACDDRMTVKLPSSAKKHLMRKALDQDMTLSEYVIQALNIVGELEGDDKIVLVAPRGHFLQQASRERKRRS